MTPPRCALIRGCRLWLTPAVLASVLSGCGGGTGALTVEQRQQQALQVHLEYSTLKHARAHANSEPRLQARTNVRRRDGLPGESSATHNSGRVVDVLTRWLTLRAGPNAPASDLAINYVVFSFLSDSAVKSGLLGQGSTQTEIWRYGVNRSWCRLLKLDFSTATAMLLDETAGSLAGVPEGTIAVTILTGSADGVLGKVRFWDVAPLSSDCGSAQVQVPDGEGAHLYNVLIPSMGPGALDQLKLVPVSEGVVADGSRKYGQYQFLFAWGRAVACAGADWIDRTGFCYRSSFRPITLTLLKDNLLVQTEPVFGTADPGGSMLINAFDAFIAAGPTGALEFRYAFGFSEWGSTLLYGFSQANRPGVGIPGTDGNAPMAWDNGVMTGVSAYPAPLSVVLVSPVAGVSHLFATNLTAKDPSRQPIGGWVCTYSSAGAAVRGCTNAFSTPSGQMVPAYSRIRNFAPYERLQALSFDPDRWITQLQGRIAGTPAQDYIRFSDWSTTQAPLQSPVGEVSYVDVPDHFFTNFAPVAGGLEAQGLYADQYSSFVVPEQHTSQLLVYRIAQVNDYSAKDEDGTQHQLVHGGIALCASRVTPDPSLPSLSGSPATSGQGNPSVGACGHLRDQASGSGAAFATARNIFPNQSFMSSPLFTRYSVSPSGIVLVTYVSLSGAIAQINASDPGTDWTGVQAWSTISQGRSAECHAVLYKPAPPAPAAQSYWTSLFSSTLKACLLYTSPSPRD